MDLAVNSFDEKLLASRGWEKKVAEWDQKLRR